MFSSGYVRVNECPVPVSSEFALPQPGAPLAVKSPWRQDNTRRMDSAAPFPLFLPGDWSPSPRAMRASSPSHQAQVSGQWTAVVNYVEQEPVGVQNFLEHPILRRRRGYVGAPSSSSTATGSSGWSRDHDHDRDRYRARGGAYYLTQCCGGYVRSSSPPPPPSTPGSSSSTTFSYPPSITTNHDLDHGRNHSHHSPERETSPSCTPFPSLSNDCLGYQRQRHVHAVSSCSGNNHGRRGSLTVTGGRSRSTSPQIPIGKPPRPGPSPKSRSLPRNQTLSDPQVENQETARISRSPHVGFRSPNHSPQSLPVPTFTRSKSPVSFFRNRSCSWDNICSGSKEKTKKESIKKTLGFSGRQLHYKVTTSSTSGYGSTSSLPETSLNRSFKPCSLVTGRRPVVSFVIDLLIAVGTMASRRVLKDFDMQGVVNGKARDDEKVKNDGSSRKRRPLSAVASVSRKNEGDVGELKKTREGSEKGEGVPKTRIEEGPDDETGSEGPRRHHESLDRLHRLSSPTLHPDPLAPPGLSHHHLTIRPTQNGRLGLETRVQRLEGDKDSLQLQVSVLQEQIEAQQEKIGDLEKLLDHKKTQLIKTEEALKKSPGDLESPRVNSPPGSSTPVGSFSTISEGHLELLVFVPCISSLVCLQSLHQIIVHVFPREIFPPIPRHPQQALGIALILFLRSLEIAVEEVEKKAPIHAVGKVVESCLVESARGSFGMLVYDFLTAETEKPWMSEEQSSPGSFTAAQSTPTGTMQRGGDSNYKQKGIKNIFGKMKRSNSGSLTEDLPPGEFKRGGTRATAGPRLDWSRPIDTPRIYLRQPMDRWDSEAISQWLQDMGLGMYETNFLHFTKSGDQLSKLTPHDLERHLGVKVALHRKKLHLAIQDLAGSECIELTSTGQMDHTSVMKWLDDIGLPQYKESFSEARVDGRMLDHLTVDDALALKLSNLLHLLSIRRGIQVLREHDFDLSLLRRRSTPEEVVNLSNGNQLQVTPGEVCLWTNHRVMEWLRNIDLSEYAPNLRGSGMLDSFSCVHGGLLVLEPRFTSELLATLLSIPPQKTLLRRHLATHFRELISRDILLQKRELENSPNHVSRGHFTLMRKRNRFEFDPDEYVCPMDSSSIYEKDREGENHMSISSRLSGDSSRDDVRSMFYHAYDGYMELAYPYDELRPITCDGVDTWGSYSLTLIDALDTLAVMGNFSEFRRVAERIISEQNNFDSNINVSVFETNIRIVGGLLSAHLLSRRAGMKLEPGWPCDGPLLRLAEDAAKRLLPAFDTPTGMPYGTVNLRYGVPLGETTITCTAGVGTFLVEFGALSRLTGNPVYEQVLSFTIMTALRAIHSLMRYRSSVGLFGNHIDVVTGKWTAHDAGIGAGVDSFYEYLVKGAILLQRPELMEMFNEVRGPIEQFLRFDDWHFWASMQKGHISMPIFQNLEAYWPGVLSLIGDLGPAMRTLHNYHQVWKKYGFLPEFYNVFSGEASTSRSGYPLRPELIESIMYLYRATRDPSLIQMAVDILQSILHSTKTKCGFATVRNVRDHQLEDRMESFFLAETTKYLYLVFDTDHFLHNTGGYGTLIESRGKTCVIEAGGYVFNTEAHPIDPGALHCCTGVGISEVSDYLKDHIVDLIEPGAFHQRGGIPLEEYRDKSRRRKSSKNKMEMEENNKTEEFDGQNKGDQGGNQDDKASQMRNNSNAADKISSEKPSHLTTEEVNENFNKKPIMKTEHMAQKDVLSFTVKEFIKDIFKLREESGGSYDPDTFAKKVEDDLSTYNMTASHDALICHAPPYVQRFGIWGFVFDES
ncbi:unnamed protein product [Darwinula stevensoni]|uniref:alpha-1,2-Mannosidase n=1 Tax=Darwinula stevensoni TaxID=69355 RepID=A0A7R8X3L9_9CRUS|nr:unnamed protein product [Darwinula stevensoni]CAG0884666.1 unnamed protein product [Darwinula stevensoni]